MECQALYPKNQEIPTKKVRLALCDNLDDLIIELLDFSINETMRDEYIQSILQYTIYLKKKLTEGLLMKDVSLGLSTDQMGACKHLITNYIEKCLIENNLSEIQENTSLFDFLELSLKNLVIAEENDFCIHVINLITTNTSVCSNLLNCNKLALMVIFGRMLSAIQSVMSLVSNYKDCNTGLNNFLQSDELHETLSNLVVVCNDHSLMSFILLHIIPKLVDVSGSYKVIHLLWSNLSTSDNNDTNILSKKLFILCGLADLFLNQSKENVEPSMVTSNEFYNIIQKGLVLDNALLRKKSLYLLKRSVDFVGSYNLQLDLTIFSWNFIKSEPLKQLWDKIFILLDVLEEKQAHLVTPVIKSVLRYESFKCIHTSWLLAVYTRVLSHDSLQVIKIGLLSFLKVKINVYSNCSYKQIICLMFQKLNNMLLFGGQSGDNEWSEMDLALKNWFSDILLHTQEEKGQFFSTIIDALLNVSWCTIPLFHILHNMSLMQECEIFDNGQLEILCQFLKEAVRAQNVFIRGAVQCAMLNVITKHGKKNVEINKKISILGGFRQTECLKRGLTTWETSKLWVQSSISEEEVLIEILFEDNNLPLENRARALVLFVDCGLIEFTSKFLKHINEQFSVLKDTRIRPYASSVESNNCLEFIHCILKESQSLSVDTDIKKDTLIQIVMPYAKEVISYVDKRMFRIDETVTQNEVELFFNCLYSLRDSKLISINEGKELVDFAQKLVLSSEQHKTVKCYFGFRVLLWYIHLANKETDINQAVRNTFKMHGLSVIKVITLILNQQQDGVMSGPLIASYIHTLWSTLHLCLKFDYINVIELLAVSPPEGFIQIATNSVEAGGRESLVPILEVVKFVLPYACNDFENCLRFLQYTWKSCFELRKIALFWPAIKSWIRMIFSSPIIIIKEMQTSLKQYADEILSQGDAVCGLSNVLLTHLKVELRSVETVEPLLEILTSAMLFGPLLRKDHRIENDTCALIRSLGSSYAVNDLIPQSDDHTSQEVRMCALSVVSRQNSVAAEQLIVGVVRRLVETDKQMTAQRQRYHGDSLHHRLKHRILQTLLVLESILAKSSSLIAKSCLVELVQWSSAGLQGESQQPSVRYQLEWLLVRSLLHSSDLVPHFWTIFSQASDERTGRICSFISVAYHLAATLKDRMFIDRCVTEILPWCMAQHFNVRLYAQVVLQKLWPLDSAVASKYEAIRTSLTKSLNTGNAVRNAEKLKTDFYFTVFHPLNHFSLETIFWELPRLSNISRDEWIPLSTLKNSLAEIHSVVPLKNQDEDLKQFSTATWVVKASAETDLEIEVEACGMQKKFVPWKGMFPELEAEAPRTELVVVASLIDKVPNLGGLARSCEVFTAQALVVASLEYTRDKLFSSLSMSAEKHINIVEVKPHDLPEYLRLMKGTGYAVVGAEQTAASVNLETYTFPKKCVLLLGNEKEGIPVNLLPLLDVCVEVKQLGLVRSLNVHVTGALFVWEYTRQYLAVNSSMVPSLSNS